MANPFDEFDTEVSADNPFDEFDAAPVEPKTKGKNTTANVFQDIARFFAPVATMGLGGVGTGIGAAAAGESFTEGLISGAQSDEFLGMDLNMETTPGKWVEEKLGEVIGKVREFGGENATKLLTSEKARNTMRSIPQLAPMALMYEAASDEQKSKIEAFFSASGTAGPEVLLTLIGGKGAKKLAEPSKEPQLKIDDILKDIDTAPTKLADEAIPTKQEELPFTESIEGRERQGDLFFDEAAQKLDESSNQGDLFRPEDTTKGMEVEFLPEEDFDFVGASFGKYDNNASGESSASLEALSRLESQNESGIRMFELDPERNSLVPLNTADRVDKRAAQGKAIVQQDADGNITVIENNSRFGNVPLTNRSKAMIEKEQPLGQSGFGKGQRGSIGFKPEPQSLEAKAKSLPKEQWIEEFNQKYPDKADFAEQVYNTLSPKNKPVKPSDSEALNMLDEWVGIPSTRIRNMSEPLLHKVQKFEKNLLGETHKRLTAIDDFSVELNSLPKQVRDVLDNAILNNDASRLDSIFSRLGGNLKENYSKARKSLDDVGQQLKDVGRLEGLRKDYFPRVVTDVDGLLEALGTTNRTELEKRLLKAQTPLEQTEMINNFLRTNYKGPYKPGFSKERKLNEVPPELQEFYASPTEAYHTYMRNATQEVETAKFFGRSAIKDPETKRIDVDQSIGKLVLDELEAGKITAKQADELQRILQARFGPGSRGSSGIIQDAKNIGYMGILGDAIAAATQLGDPLISVYANGLRPTLQAIVTELPGVKRKVSMEDFGLLDHISEEFVNDRKSAKLLNNVFKLAGFSTIDKLGKNIVLNAALNKATKQVQSPQGLREFANDWQGQFGEEFPQLVSDLQNGIKSDVVDTMLFSRLADIQPITKMEMPQKYLEMPNGRIIYMLKTFMLKQADLMRNDSYNEIKKGNIAKGVGNLARYGIIMGLAGAATEEVKNWLLGKESKEFEASDIAVNMLKTFGLSQYVLDKAKSGKVGEAATNMVLPPFSMYDPVMKDIVKLLDGDETTEPDWKGVQRVPLIGKFMYNWFLGGAEKADEKLYKEEMKELVNF